MRNHSVQYTSEPDFGWEKLRRAWPFVYESHEELQTETWTKVKIEVKGRSARLYINGSEQPSLIVDGLKGEDLRGGVALWAYQGEEAYFSNLRVTNATPLPVKNGSDTSGNWEVKCGTDAGPIGGILQLKRDGIKMTGMWSGDLGNERRLPGLGAMATWSLASTSIGPLTTKVRSRRPSLRSLAGSIATPLEAARRWKAEPMADGRRRGSRRF
jgi:hypothetical protein